MIRHATPRDLPAIVDIYNASIPGRIATADVSPVSVADREGWFAKFEPARRPLWVDDEDNVVVAWLSLSSFYGRPAYSETVEVSVYVHPNYQLRGHARLLLEHAIERGPSLRIYTLLAFTFAHNVPGVRLFTGAGFEAWGRLPGVARLDGIRRDLLILGRPL